MKTVIISDVHAYYESLVALEEKEKTWDKLLFVGDAVDAGLLAHETLTWLREHDAICVLGNHDAKILGMIDEGKPRVDPEKAENFAEFNIATMTDEDAAYLRTFPVERVETIDGITYCMMHVYQHEYGDDEAINHQMRDYNYITKGVAYWEEKVGPTAGTRVLLVGDTHMAMYLQMRPDLFFMNPGAMGYLLGEDHKFPGGQYIVVEDGAVSLRTVDYDATDSYNRVLTNGFKGYDKTAGINQYRPCAKGAKKDN